MLLEYKSDQVTKLEQELEKRKKVGKTIGLWVLYILVAIIVLKLIVTMFKRSVRAERKKKNQKK